MNIGIVWLRLFPFASIFKTEKAQRAAVRDYSQKILQKWIGSSYNKMTAKILFYKKKKTKPFFHLLALSFSVTQHCVVGPSSVHNCQNIYYGGFSGPADQHSAAWSNLHLPLLSPPPILPSSFPTAFHSSAINPSSLHFNQGSFLIKTNKYEEAINILKEADGGIVPFRYYIKP